MITRKEYMSQLQSGKISHADYYAQFCDADTRRTLLSLIGEQTIKSSVDSSFNDIPLARWDRLPTLASWTEKLKQAGEQFSLSTKICIYKEQARQIRAESEA